MARMVGLTGGIGTGKSSVARLLEELGAVVVDADAIVHEIQAPGSPLLAEIAAAFGPEVLDANGTLDRAALAERVFRDDAARARLNAIMHAAVGAEMARRTQRAHEDGAPLVVLDIPLLYETRGGEGFDAVVVVYAPREMQVERVVARDGVSREDVERRLAAQLPIEEKRARADHVIDNSGSLEETRRQVRAVFEKLTAPA